MFTIHCFLHHENLVEKNIGSCDIIAILQTAVSSVNKIRTLALQVQLFKEAHHDKKFHQLVYSTDIHWLSIGSSHTRFVIVFDKRFRMLQSERHYSAEFTY